MNRYLVFFCKFNGSDVKNLGAQACQFQHLIIRNGVYLARRRTDVGISSIYSIDISEYFTFIRFQYPCQSHGGCVRPAPAQRGNVFVVVYPLKTCHNNYFVV